MAKGRGGVPKAWTNCVIMSINKVRQLFCLSERKILQMEWLKCIPTFNYPLILLSGTEIGRFEPFFRLKSLNFFAKRVRWCVEEMQSAHAQAEVRRSDMYSIFSFYGHLRMRTAKSGPITSAFWRGFPAIWRHLPRFGVSVGFPLIVCVDKEGREAPPRPLRRYSELMLLRADWWRSAPAIWPRPLRLSSCTRSYYFNLVMTDGEYSNSGTRLWQWWRQSTWSELEESSTFSDQTWNILKVLWAFESA